MSKLKSYKQLKVWQKGIQLCNQTFSLTNEFPKEERYGLISQMRRCAVSVPSNIAEGFGRCSKKDFIHFLQISYGSLLELETQLLIAKQQQFISSEIKEYKKDLIILSKMLGKLILSIKQN
jgi:four helix bundle protein